MLQKVRGATDGCFGGAPVKVVLSHLDAWFESRFELADGTSLFGRGLSRNNLLTRQVKDPREKAAKR